MMIVIVRIQQDQAQTMLLNVSVITDCLVSVIPCCTLCARLWCTPKRLSKTAKLLYKKKFRK